MCVTFLEVGKAQAALDVVKDTPEVFLNVGDESRAAQAYGNLGSALEACGKTEAAEKAYRTAADLFVSTGDAENHRYTLQALSRLQLRQGRPVEALTTMEAGLESQPPRGIRDRLLRSLLKLPFRFLGK